MPRGVRVYSAEIDGVNEWIVAAPNQKAALEALGVHQDLFAQGRARIEKDEEKAAQAAARPGVPLRRPKGSRGPFAADGGGDAWAAALKAAPKGAGRKPPAKSDKPPKPEKPARAEPEPRRSRAAPRAKPVRKVVRDRRPVMAAEAALRTFEREALRELGALKSEREAIDRRERQLKADHEKKREALERALRRATAAYERSG